MDLNKTITYEELLSMWHFIELNGNNLAQQAYTHVWATGANIPEGKMVYRSILRHIFHLSKNSIIRKQNINPIISYGNTSGVARCMIYDTNNNKYITTDVNFYNNWNTPQFIPTKIVDIEDASHTLNISDYSVHGWIYGKEVII